MYPIQLGAPRRGTDQPRHPSARDWRGSADRCPVRRSIARLPALAILCGLPLLLLAALVATATLDVLTVPASSVRGGPAAELGIGELEMGRDFGKPAVPPERGPVATAILYGVLLLCPAKFVLLWALQRRESRQMRAPDDAPSFGDA